MALASSWSRRPAVTPTSSRSFEFQTGVTGSQTETFGYWREDLGSSRCQGCPHVRALTDASALPKRQLMTSGASFAPLDQLREVACWRQDWAEESACAKDLTSKRIW